MAQYGETTAKALDSLLRHPKSIDELARLLECGRSYAQALVGRLLAHGHVVREQKTLGTVILRRDPGGDVTRANRVYFYSTTDKGRERLRRIRARPKNS